MDGKSKFEAAACEAYEEAGLRGKIIKDHSYTITIHHKDSKVTLELFPMKVSKVLRRWPERRERKRRIVSLSKAQKMISFDDLKKCQRKWERDFCDR